MENPNEDTEWNDVLRQKGILPPKEKTEKTFTEDEIVNIVESTVQEKLSGNEKQLEDLTLEELEELEDEEDERVLLEYRRKRMAEINAIAQKSKYGDVREISADDYVEQVNKAGDGIWVVLHLYKPGIPYCTLINQHLNLLAAKFKATKFLKSVSTTCIPNYPDKNVPTIFVYYDGKMKKQFIGPDAFGGMKLKVDELEWMLAEAGAVQTDLEEDPRPKTRDVLMSTLRADYDETSDW
ncbi:phosducin-like protein 3 [Ornithodoros turicata]|uniref:Putative conserved phosducin-like protein n=1 Tax=Ornithodoros turicata TaxID=34597 RepID=A0A2R5LIJ4_9ACAR